MGLPLRVGIVGAGKISEQYLAALPVLRGLRLVAVADLDADRARQTAEQHSARALSVDELLDAPDVDAVLNLTIPSAHVDIGTRALLAGKHVFAEKPLGLDPQGARAMLDLADSHGLRFGSAPDTVLGTGIQTARHAIDTGRIGQPVGASVFWSAPGHERWHPAPDFYYRAGGGPLFDMGPYYLTALVHFFGPVVRVSGAASRSSRQRVVEAGPRAGEPIEVEVDTHVTALLEHESGVISTVTVSFEIWQTRSPLFEVFGTEGTLAVADPNMFAEPVAVATREEPEWSRIQPAAGFVGVGRGIGLAEMAASMHAGRAHRASGRLALHVLEIMDGILRASERRESVAITSRVDRPAIVPLGPPPGLGDDAEGPLRRFSGRSPIRRATAAW